MSSQDEAPDVDHDRSSKKRKIQRACDYCRRKKSDGPRMPNNRCSKCIYRKTECTYVEPLYVNISILRCSYVHTLESRMHKMEALVKKMCPDSDLSKDLEEILDKETPSQQSISSRHGVGTPLEVLGTSTASAGSPLSTAPTPPQSADHPSSDEEPEMPEHLIEGMLNLSIRPSNIRFHGESSGLVFLRSALGMKQVYGGGERDKPLQDVLRNSRAVPDSVSIYWEAPVYERPFPPDVFPSPDLMTALIELYFTHVNAFTPLLHRPSFEHAVSDKLHLRSQGFGSVLLLVCACASRFTDDPRAYINPTEHHSAGWRWYLEAEGVHKSTIAPAELYDLQKAVLMAQFLQNSTGPHTSWTVIGLGLRKAVEAGVHRRRVYKELTPEDELWRRAFWALVTMDWINGHGLGRPCSIRDEDMDTNLPTECDDEYWTAADPNDAFKQPLGKPSKVTAFNLLVRLVQIIAYASRTIFSANPPRSKTELRGQDWEQRIVAELDSALNRWAASIPDHLRWDPKREDPLWLAQSAMLYAGYYQTQITVHRPFILSKRDRIFPFPSIIICANAARSCIRVLRQYFERTGTPGYQNAGALFAASTILMINIWAEKRAGKENNAVKDLADVRSTLDMLLAAEP
ncbi:fungal-specific transcription factor domain-containing protein [Trametes elegans]|nr:fungal-specific transcription factor domain-containing protein [Trametes elegans]